MSQQPLRPFVQITPYNWKPILFTALIASIRMQIDLPFSNLFLEHSLMLFTSEEISHWMNMFCVLLDHRLCVSKSDFDSYFKWLVIYRQLQIKRQGISSSTSERSSFTSSSSRRPGAFTRGRRILLQPSE